ncbi:MAG TPA: sulfatase [Actinomycetota bacterium]|nr:sulfatase [Actinomycetota bacterium]
MSRALAAVSAAWLVFAASACTGSEPGERWNVVVIVTDDQRADSIGHSPPAMPYLESSLADPGEPWVVFENAFASSPVCCPSRATMFTGRLPHVHGVLTNADGPRLDETSTFAAWLREAGYFTGLAGKYLNGYPFRERELVPAGWDRWWGKRQGLQTSTYVDYELIEQGRPVTYGHDEPDYLTDVLADLAAGFIDEAPGDRPFLLWVAPTAPHPPWTPANRHDGAFEDLPLDAGPAVGEEDVEDKPAWIRALPAIGEEQRAALLDDQRRSLESLLAVDDLVRRVVETLRERGDLEQTMVVVVSDNGFSFGEHRWVRKSCPYDECVRVPFVVRYPGAGRRVENALVSTADLAPTIAELAEVEIPPDLDGRSLAPLLEGRDGAWDGAVVLESFDDRTIPVWRQIRTPAFAYVEYETGERELYDLTADPHQLTNVIADPTYSAERERLSERLADLTGG